MSTTIASAVPSRWPNALRFGWADLLGPIGIASVVIVICMWLRTGGIQTGVASVEGALSSLGPAHRTACPSDLMILQVVMLARIPWVERAWGHDLLTRRHRWIGFWSFWLMIAHVVLFAVERAVREPARDGWTALCECSSPTRGCCWPPSAPSC